MNKLTAEVARQDLNHLKSWIETCGISMKEERHMQALEIALPILEQQEKQEKQERGGWVAWGGGKCPVSKDVVIEFKLRDGGCGNGKSKYFVWAHDEHPNDIIAYRIIPARATNQNGEQ